MRRDPNTLDLLQQQLCLAEDLRFWPVRERGELVYRIEIPSEHKFFRVGYAEYVLISLLDGSTTLPQACGLAAAKLGKQAPTSTQAIAIAKWLLKNQLAHLSTQQSLPRAHSGHQTIQKIPSILKSFNPFWIKIPLPNSERWIGVLAKCLEPLFGLSAVLMGVALLLAASVVLIGRWTEFRQQSGEVFSNFNWIWLLMTWLGLKVIHEFGHAAACARAGGSVRESGIVLVLLAPIAFVDVSSCWRLNSRWARIGISAAGMYVELLIAALALLAWSWWDGPQWDFWLHNLVLSAGLSTLVFNANVLMRFDGYYILADLIDVPNLYSQSSLAIRQIMWGWATGDGNSGQSLTGWRKSFVITYGFAASCWRIMVCVTLAIAAATMFSGAGIVIAIFGVVIWVGNPLVRFVHLAKGLWRRDQVKFVRAAALSTSMAVGIFACFFWVPIPTAVNAPGMVQFAPDAMVRSLASGFIAEVHVQDGSVVQAGDLLFEVENQDLTNQWKQLGIEWQQNDLRLRAATDKHNASLKQVLLEDQRAVEKQLLQLEARVASLRMTAPHDGVVVARGLASRVGTYINEGEPLLHVASDHDKELVALLDHHAIDEVRRAVGSEVKIRTAGFSMTKGRLDRVEPRASSKLSNLAFASTEGGSLPVQIRASDDYQLLEPHFQARIRLDRAAASELPVGLRVQTAFGSTSQTLATKIERVVRSHWYTVSDLGGSQ